VPVGSSTVRLLAATEQRLTELPSGPEDAEVKNVKSDKVISSRQP